MLPTNDFTYARVSPCGNSRFGFDVSSGVLTMVLLYFIPSFVVMMYWHSIFSRTALSEKYGAVIGKCQYYGHNHKNWRQDYDKHEGKQSVEERLNEFGVNFHGQVGLSYVLFMVSRD
jgi:hypothetical protein